VDEVPAGVASLLKLVNAVLVLALTLAENPKSMVEVVDRRCLRRSRIGDPVQDC